MPSRMNIAFFGSSLVSAYWNGAATYYRGLIRSLHELGHRVTFYEPDAYGRQSHRDMDDPQWARVEVYSADGPDGVARALEAARDADLLIKASGVGVFDELLEAAVLEVRNPRSLVAFWDVDAPATLERVQGNPNDPFRKHIPRYDVVFTYGGGKPVIDAYTELGARVCVPIYNALDPTTHHPASVNPAFAADLSLLANRLPDREARVDEFFLRTAAAMPQYRFVLGGNGWTDKPLPSNVNYVGHVYTRNHNTFNASALAVLNVTRDSMTRFGFSPATRVFEAAGASACIISDAWEGIDMFLEPGREILLAERAEDVIGHLEALTPQRARAMGRAARMRILAEHTYDHRARQVEQVLSGLSRSDSIASASREAQHREMRP